MDMHQVTALYRCQASCVTSLLLCEGSVLGPVFMGIYTVFMGVTVSATDS